jgi:hypothetical protein
MIIFNDPIGCTDPAVCFERKVGGLASRQQCRLCQVRSLREDHDLMINTVRHACRPAQEESRTVQHLVRLSSKREVVNANDRCAAQR